MTTSTVARKVRSRRTAFAANPKRFCTACRLERSTIEQRNEDLNGRCTDCADTNAAPLVATSATAPLNHLAAQDVHLPIPQDWQDVTTRVTADETAAGMAAAGLDPNTADVRRCGNCDANISTLAGAQFCSEVCKVEAAAAQAKQDTKPQPKPLNGDVATAVRWSIRDDLTEFEIRTGLNAAFLDRRANGGGRFTPEGIAAAGRAWFDDYNRNTAEKGKRNTAILRALNAADRLR